MNQEMIDSICKCFTGRISRLINCLNGFSDKVIIQISKNEEINNIISNLVKKYNDIDLINPILKDRINVIKVPDPDEKAKIIIGQKYLVKEKAFSDKN